MINNNQQAVIKNTIQETIANDSSTSSSFNLQVNATDGKAKINIESNINTDTDTNINKRKVEQKNKFTKRLEILLNMFSLLDEIKKTTNLSSLELDRLLEQLSDMITEEKQRLNDPNTSYDDENPTTILDLTERYRNTTTNIELLHKKVSDTLDLARKKGFHPLEQKAEDPTVEQRAESLALEEDTSQLCVIC